MIKSIVRVARRGPVANQDIVLADVDDEGGASEVDEEDEEQHLLTTQNPLKRKRESILRPKSNKAARKYQSRRRSSRSPDVEQLARVNLEENTDTDADEDSGAGGTEADGAVLDDAQDDDVEVEDAEIDDAEVNDTPIIPPAMAPNTQPSSAIVPPPPKAVKATSKIAKVVLWADDTNNPIPSYYEPHGSGDTWMCPYQACSYQVWNAREAPSIQMIKEHFVETHASNAEDLVYEERRPWVSVE